MKKVQELLTELQEIDEKLVIYTAKDFDAAWKGFMFFNTILNDAMLNSQKEVNDMRDHADKLKNIALKHWNKVRDGYVKEVKALQKSVR